MEKLKEALIQFTHSNPSLFPSNAANSYPVLIEQCFPRFFKDFQNPNHPPYAAMIYKAICELNKKGGSSEKSISEYIQKEYADLPWAHATLLKHHLEKLCDRKEICMTDKQCYLLAVEESESGKKSSGPSKKHKKQKSRPDSKVGKKSSSPHKKYKKNKKNPLGIKEASDKEQIGLRKRKRKQGLKSKVKSSKRVKKRSINEDTKLHLLGEANLKQNDEVIVDESHEQKQTLEVQTGDIHIQEQKGLHKRKQGLKSKRKSSKRMKKHTINEETKLQLLGDANLKQNNEVTDDVLHEQNQIVEVNRGDIQIQEQDEAGQESDHDNAGCVNLEQTQMKKNPELLQPEESPDSNLILHGNGKRVCTRSQLKRVSKKDAIEARSELTDSLGHANMPKDKPIIVQHLLNEQQVMDIITVRSTVDTKQQLSRSPSLNKPRMEFLQPMSSKVTSQFPDDELTAGPSSTEVQDPISYQQGQQTEKLQFDDKPKYKRRGRPPKPMEPEKSEVKSQQSAKKLISQLPDDEPTVAPSSTEVQDPISSQQDQQTEKLPLDDKPKYKRRGRPPKPVKPEKSKFKSQQLAKKAGKKKGHPKYKGLGRHKMTRRSSRKPSY